MPITFWTASARTPTCCCRSASARSAALSVYEPEDVEEYELREHKIRVYDFLLATLKGLLTYVEDGNVIELRPCGFVEEVRAAIAQAEARKYKDVGGLARFPHGMQ